MSSSRIYTADLSSAGQTSLKTTASDASVVLPTYPDGLNLFFVVVSGQPVSLNNGASATGIAPIPVGAFAGGDPVNLTPVSSATGAVMHGIGVSGSVLFVHAVPDYSAQ